MSRFTRMETLTAMKSVGMVPVFYHADVEVAKAVIVACADGGANVIEFTNRGDRAIDVFRELASFCATQRPDVYLGAGSVVDAPTAAMYIAAGADFIVSPVLDSETATLCNTRKISYSPGCATPSEVHAAHKLGVDVVKLFPGGPAGGPAMVKAIKAPMPWAEIMPTGGVLPSEENLRQWFDAGIVCAGMGSQLLSKDVMADRDWPALTEKVRQTISLIQTIRG